MKKLTKIILTVGAFMIVLLIGLTLRFNLNKSDDASNYSDYYQTLANQCLQNNSSSCCMDSVEIMKRNNYKLIPDNGCQEGLRGNGLECIGSLGWCEPADSPTNNSGTRPQTNATPAPTADNNTSQDFLQTFELKIGEQAVYKGQFNLNFELTEIGKMKDYRNIKNLTEEEIGFFDKGPCEQNGCANILEENYYIIKIKNLDLDSCGDRRVVLRAKGLYECPSFYNFNVDVVNSNDKKIIFSVDYVPAGLDSVD